MSRVSTARPAQAAALSQGPACLQGRPVPLGPRGSQERVLASADWTRTEATSPSARSTGHGLGTWGGDGTCPGHPARQLRRAAGPYLTRGGLTSACSGCSGPSTCRASSSSWAMTSRVGPRSSEHTGVFISCSKIRYLLSIWHSLASRLEYCRDRGGQRRPGRRGKSTAQVPRASSGPPAHDCRDASVPYATGHLSGFSRGLARRGAAHEASPCQRTHRLCAGPEAGHVPVTEAQLSATWHTDTSTRPVPRPQLLRTASRDSLPSPGRPHKSKVPLQSEQGQGGDPRGRPRAHRAADTRVPELTGLSLHCAESCGHSHLWPSHQPCGAHGDAPSSPPAFLREETDSHSPEL